MATVVFVHGACVRDAGWWWSRMTGPLAEQGLASVVVPLHRGVEFDAGHHPFLSRPEAFALTLAKEINAS